MPEDLKALSENLSKLAPIAPDLVEVSTIRDKFGFPEPAKGAVCIGRKDNADEVQVVEEVKDEKQEKIEKQAAEADLLAEHDGRDWIDDLSDESLAEWIPLVKPARDQLEELLAASTSYEDFAAGLAGLARTLDVKELQEAVASAMFVAWKYAKDGEKDA